MKIRIALAINSDGHWAAYGCWNESDHDKYLNVIETLWEVSDTDG